MYHHFVRQNRTAISRVHKQWLALCLILVSGCTPCQATADEKGLVTHQPRWADFKQQQPSRDVRYMADWVVHSGDNSHMPFVIIDKTDARAFVFDLNGQMLGTAPVLLGMARGDTSVPGIGDRKLSLIRPYERTTPAGRFLSSLGRNIQGEEIIWVDYESGVSLHPVITGNSGEKRLQRLATLSPLDNRISFGCINVPATFFATVVRQAFAETNGIVYVLPETRSVLEFFNAYDVKEHNQQ